MANKKNDSSEDKKKAVIQIETGSGKSKREIIKAELTIEIMKEIKKKNRPWRIVKNSVTGVLITAALMTAILSSEPFEQAMANSKAGLELFNNLGAEDRLPEARENDIRLYVQEGVAQHYGHKVTFDTNLDYGLDYDPQFPTVIKAGEAITVPANGLPFNTDNQEGSVFSHWEDTSDIIKNGEGKPIDSEIPQKLSDLGNDRGFVFTANYKPSFAEKVANVIPFVRPIKDKLTKFWAPAVKAYEGASGNKTVESYYDNIKNN